MAETEESWNRRVSFDEHPVPSEERDVQQALVPAVSDLSPFERISSYNPCFVSPHGSYVLLIMLGKRAKGTVVLFFL